MLSKYQKAERRAVSGELIVLIPDYCVGSPERQRLQSKEEVGGRQKSFKGFRKKRKIRHGSIIQVKSRVKVRFFRARKSMARYCEGECSH